jgi:NADPH-dependent curcumin reductase CurA
MTAILKKSLTVRGFIQAEFARDLMPEFLERATPWARDGTLQYCEDIVDGLENAPEAFIGMLEGRNFGKLLVRVSCPHRDRLSLLTNPASLAVTDKHRCVTNGPPDPG